MESGTQKKPFHCPSCGFVQLEPPHLISTYCRACGDYYEVRRPGAATRARSVFPPLPPLTAQRKDVFCHRCGTTHGVSVHAKCTICPGCNAGIDLVDIEFLSPASRPVDTRGNLFVGPDAALGSSWIICGSARIEGRVSGPLCSEGEVVLATTASLVCEINAPTVVIEKRARVQLTMPIETDSLVVRGHLTGIVRCRGLVHILRGGVLEADVRARSVIVEKGGCLTGDLQVDRSQPHLPGRSFGDRRVRREFSPLMAAHPSPSS